MIVLLYHFLLNNYMWFGEKLNYCDNFVHMNVNTDKYC